MADSEKKKVLFVDDEVNNWVGRFNIYLEQYGLEFIGETEVGRALHKIEILQPDIVLLDIMFPGANGRLEPRGSAILAEIRERYPELPVVMLTATLSDASYGIDEQDFGNARYMFAKERFLDNSGDDPYEELAQQLLGAIEESHDRRSLDERLGFVVGVTEKMKKVVATMLQVAPTASIVLLCGESGTGKELAAHAIHRLSPRRDAPFVVINCGGLTDEMLESQLFGYEKGAFASADHGYSGFFEQADSGTLFLDEVDAMSRMLQDKLLRVIQDQRIRRIGSQDERKVDVRLIVATNKSLSDLVSEGRFRPDLYYRLRVIELELPSLRERLDDLPSLYRVLLTKLNARLGKRTALQPREDVLEKLKSYDWPGNIRELEHVLENSMIIARSNVLTPSVIQIEKKTMVINADKAELAAIMAGEILEGKSDWRALRQIHGEIRHRVLRELLTLLVSSQGKPPSSSQLAELLNVNEANMRRILSESGIRLREYAICRSR